MAVVIQGTYFERKDLKETYRGYSYTFYRVASIHSSWRLTILKDPQGETVPNPFWNPKAGRHQVAVGNTEGRARKEIRAHIDWILAGCPAPTPEEELNLF